MLEIHACKDIRLYTNFLAEHNLPPYAFVVEAFNKDAVVGFGIFEYGDDFVKLFAIECEELSLYDGIARTILFKASMKGIDKAEFLLEDMAPIYSLKLLKKGDRTLPSIQDVMGGCESCKLLS